MNPNPTLSSNLLWITVPGGITTDGDAGQAIVRVLVVPRLQGSSLAAEGLASWPPPALATSPLAVDFAAAPEQAFQTVTVPPPHGQAQPGLWEAFFGPGTPLQPARQSSAPPLLVKVAETGQQATAIRDTFTKAAATKITADPASHAKLDRVVRKQLTTYWSDDAPAPPPSPIVPAPAATLVDFHRVLSLLREHPAVLRALGLIIELRLPVAQLPAGWATGVVRVRWPDAPPAPTLPALICPWTQYEYAPASQRFLPASTPAISAGMVALTDDRAPANGPAKKPRWEVVTVDIDAGTQRLRAAAQTMMAATTDHAAAAGNAIRPVDEPGAPLPVLRTAGLLLVRHERQNDFDAAAARTATDQRVLTADDLVLGYRIDINRGGEWRSLHERAATYRAGGITVDPAQPFEEGHLKAQAAVRDNDGTLRTDAVVARWNGWSLAVAPPVVKGAAARAQPARALTTLPFDFSFDFEVKKGSLPLLRFTQAYQMRARVADIAGGGLALADPAAGRCATTAVVYRRYEPVLPPALLLPVDQPAAGLGPGEAVDQLVIRSDPAAQPPLNAADFLAQHPQWYPAATRRELLPPAVALALAEQHPGVLVGTAAQTLAALRRAAPARQEGGLFTSSLTLPDPAAEGIAVFSRPALGGAAREPQRQGWGGTWPERDTKQLLLSEAPDNASAATWAAQQFSVALAPADQLTLELSSFLPGDFLDHFAIKEQLPSESESTVLLGRHPLVTPVRTVRLVHAVRRPRSAPAGTLAPRREPGQTFALLNPAPALLTIDAKSTAKLEITAAWTEYTDDTTSRVGAVPVQAVAIGLDDKVLAETLRHEFGDTRHRMVSYTLTAVSRFRQFFHAQEDAAAFLAPAPPLPATSVLSSARPGPPIVLSTRPTFRWEQEPAVGDNPGPLVRRSGLRVELQRPWFQTGQGEQLAVIVGPTNQPDPLAQPFLTQVGRDPIWDTPSPDQWPTSQALATSAGAAAKLTLDPSGATGVAVPYDVWFQGDRWYADIALPGVAASSYCPFVQLTVARYQPDSLAGLELSSIVHTEMVPLLPDRTLSIARPALDTVEIRLEGLGPAGPQPNRVDLLVEQCVLPPGMVASAVELTALTPPDDETLAWVAIATATGNLGARLSAQLPAAPAGPLRVRVREVERIGPVGDAAGELGTSAELTQRVVFTGVQPVAATLTHLPPLLTHVFGGGDGVVYTIADSGQLFWHHHDGWQEGSSRWTASQGRQVSTGWDFKRVFSSGDGVIYAVTANNDLLWFRHEGREDGSARWTANQGQRVGTGWDFKHLFAAGKGVIYAITATNDLLWYHHDGWEDGSWRWAVDHGLMVGTGWDFQQVFSGGQGVLYARTATDDLLWFRHDGQADGSPNWTVNHGLLVGNGWAFPQIFPGEDGVIYGITATNDLLWYRHSGWKDGSRSWAVDHGLVVGTGWKFQPRTNTSYL